MDEKEKQQDQAMKEFLVRKRSVTLTEKEWGDLSTYILITTEYRKKEPDGTPMVPHAADNAAFWKDMDRKLDRIRRIIEAPYLPPEEVADL